MKQSLETKMKNLENANYYASEMGKVSDFIASRKLRSQERREADLAGLEGLGVRFNIEERTR